MNVISLSGEEHRTLPGRTAKLVALGTCMDKDLAFIFMQGSSADLAYSM